MAELFSVKKLDTNFGARKRYRFRTRQSYSDSAYPVFCGHPRLANLAYVCERVHMHARPRALTRRRARQRVNTCATAGALAYAARDAPQQRQRWFGTKVCSEKSNLHCGLSINHTKKAGQFLSTKNGLDFGT